MRPAEEEVKEGPEGDARRIRPVGPSCRTRAAEAGQAELAVGQQGIEWTNGPGVTEERGREGAGGRLMG